MTKNSVQKNRNRLISNTIMLYIMTAGKYLLPLVTLPYLTRVLTPKYYGITTYMTSTMTYFQVLIDFGFIYSATREASLFRENKRKLGEILSETIVAKLLLCIVGFFIMLIMVPFVTIMRENFPLTVLYFLSVAVTIFIPDYIYRGIEKMEIVSIRFILARLVSTILTFILIKSSDDLILMPVLLICGNLAAVIFSFVYLYREEDVTLVAIRWCNVIDSIKSSSVFFVATFATTAFGATTTFLMGVRNLSAITTAEIAFWGLAYQIICTIEMLYDPIISSIYPHMVKTKDYSIIKKALLIFMPLILLGVIVCYLLADYGMNLAGGPEYIEAAPIFRILLPLLLFSFPAQLLGFPLLAPIGKEKMASISTVISAVFHVSGLIALIVVGKFTLINIAILRTCTNVVLLSSRVVMAKRAFSSYRRSLN